MQYVRDIPVGSDPAAILAEVEHVRVHLAAVADADDNPATLAGQVQVDTDPHPDDPTMLRITGTLDAEPVADYLSPGYDPLAGVDPDLYDLEVGRALVDEELTR